MLKYIRVVLIIIICAFLSVSISAQDKNKEISIDEIEFREIKIIPTSESTYSLMSDADIAELGKTIISSDQGIVAYGFTDEEKTIHEKFFALGNLYADLMIKLSGEYDKNEVISMIKSMQDGLDSLGASNAIYTYLFNLENMVIDNKYPNDIIKRFLTMLYPFIEEFAKSSGADVSLQAGHWLVELALIAASQNETLYRQSEVATYLASEYEKLDAPKGVIKALKDMADILAKPKLSEDDFDTIITISEDARRFLK